MSIPTPFICGVPPPRPPRVPRSFSYESQSLGHRAFKHSKRLRPAAALCTIQWSYHNYDDREMNSSFILRAGTEIPNDCQVVSVTHVMRSCLIH